MTHGGSIEHEHGAGCEAPLVVCDSCGAEVCAACALESPTACLACGRGWQSTPELV
jgi:hypothetical protein